MIVRTFLKISADVLLQKLGDFEFDPKKKLCLLPPVAEKWYYFFPCPNLTVLQNRLNRQQRDMEDERGRLQEVISKMEARLNEQTRLLEQVSWC